MKSIEIQINASKERIWSIFTDRSNMTDWRPTHTNYSSPNSDIRGVGARFTHTVWRPGEHGPSSYETTSEIIAVEEGESVSMKIIGNAILNSMQTHCSLLADVDSTRVIIKMNTN